MAELIPFTIAEGLLMKLCSTDFLKMGSIYGFGKELSKVQIALFRNKAVLLVVDEKQASNHSVGAWVRTFKDAVYDADDFSDEFAAQHLRRTAELQGGIGKPIS